MLCTFSEKPFRQLLKLASILSGSSSNLIKSYSLMLQKSCPAVYLSIRSFKSFDKVIFSFFLSTACFASASMLSKRRITVSGNICLTIFMWFVNPSEFIRNSPDKISFFPDVCSKAHIYSPQLICMLKIIASNGVMYSKIRYVITFSDKKFAEKHCIQ